MRITDTTTSAIGTAAALWVIASGIAAVDRRASRAIAVASLAAAASVVGIALAVRQAVRQAPRAEYYRGYGDASADALEAAQLHHCVAVADMAPVGHDWQNTP